MNIPETNRETLHNPKQPLRVLDHLKLPLNHRSFLVDAKRTGVIRVCVQYEDRFLGLLPDLESQFRNLVSVPATKQCQGHLCVGRSYLSVEARAFGAK